MKTLAEILEEAREMETSNKRVLEVLPKFLATLLKCQKVFISVLECPAGRILDCLTALSGQTYQLFGGVMLEEPKFYKSLKKLAKNDLKIMQK